jgi:poly-beta-1,6 N-acetyl-D-glucosamine synthase
MFFIGLFFMFIFLILHYKNIDRLYLYPKSKRFPKVSVLVPAYNEEKCLENTINALLNVQYPAELKEIIIVNDGSKDRTAEIAKRLASQHKEVIFLDKKNSGKANSLNEAIKIATGEIVAVVDADSYPKKDSFIKMVGYFEEEGVAAVTSRVLIQNHSSVLGRFQVMDYSIIAWTRKLLDFVDSVYVTNGPLSMYRKEKVIEVGGFDPKNLTEDIEITWNLLSRGYKTRMSYGAIVYTTAPEKLKGWINQRIRWNLGGIQTVQKYYKSMFKDNAFGFFVIPYVAGSFFLALLGFVLMIRYFWLKGNSSFYSVYYMLQGYNPFRYFEFSFYITFLIIVAAIYFGLAIWYYKEGFRNSETGNKSVLKILAFSFIYRSLYIIPLILALYKLAKGDLRWYTK